MPTMLFNDTFTASDNTQLVSHTPDTGGSWVAADSNNSASSNTLINNGKLGLVASATWGLYYTSDLHSEDQYAKADIVVNDPTEGDGNQVGVATRMSTDGTSMYALWVRSGQAYPLQLYKYDNGSSTKLGTWSIPNFDDGTAVYNIELQSETDGTDVTLGVWLDGTLVAEITDTDGVTGGSPGVRLRADTSELEIDNFQSGDMADAAVNTPPTADAGADQNNIEAGASVTLDGTGSTDGDGTIATYTWTQTAGTSVSLANSDTATPSFIAPSTDSDQTLTFSLVVTDNDGSDSAEDTVSIGVLAQTETPIENTITVDEVPKRFNQLTSESSATTTITGTYTGEPTTIERQINSDSWETAIASPTGGVFSDTFELPKGINTVSYRFSNDTDVVQTLTEQVAGDVYVCSGQSNMSGRGSELQVVTETGAYLFGNDDVFKDLVDPYDRSQDQVDDVSADSPYGSFIPLLANKLLQDDPTTPVCFIPCAKGGTSIADWSRGTLATTLYGSMLRRVNAVGGAKTMLWQQGERDSTINTELSDYESAMIQLADDVNNDFSANTIIIALHTITDSDYDGVSDTTGQDAIRQAQINAASASENIQITEALTDLDISAGDGLHIKTSEHLDVVAQRTANVIIGGNVKPIANAGNNQSNIAAGTTVTLDGTGSTDSDGTIVSYQWTQISGVSVTLNNANLSQATFTAPSSDTAQTLVFELVVTDDAGDTSDPVTTQVDVLSDVTNTPPTANAGLDQSVGAGVTVQVSASGSSDGDGTIVGYKWRETTNSGVTLSSTVAENISFTSPVSNTGQTVTLELIVTDDGGLDSDPAYVDIVVAADTTAPVITLLGQPSVTVTQGDTYIDAGATATDNLDGDLTSSIVTVNPVDTSNVGSYVVTYNVSDGAGNSATEVTRSVIVEALSTTIESTLSVTYTGMENKAYDTVVVDTDNNEVIFNQSSIWTDGVHTFTFTGTPVGTNVKVMADDGTSGVLQNEVTK